MIRTPKSSEIATVKKFVDQFDEMDTVKETFPLTYYRRLLKNGIVLIDEQNKELDGI